MVRLGHSEVYPKVLKARLGECKPWSNFRRRTRFRADTIEPYVGLNDPEHNFKPRLWLIHHVIEGSVCQHLLSDSLLAQLCRCLDIEMEWSIMFAVLINILSCHLIEKGMFDRQRTWRLLTKNA
jgi:hypothetical protein